LAQWSTKLECHRNIFLVDVHAEIADQVYKALLGFVADPVRFPRERLGTANFGRGNGETKMLIAFILSRVYTKTYS